MSYDADPDRTTESNVRRHIVRMVGIAGGASAPTKIYGKGITISRTAAGRYLLTWADNPGTFIGCSKPLIQATTPGDVAGHDVVVEPFTSTPSTQTFTLAFRFYGATQVLHDLDALEWISMSIAFKLTGP